MAELDSEDPAEVAIDARFDPTGVAIVTVSGELDISNAGTLEQAVASMTADRPERLIFDLGGLRFMDSAGIAVLLDCAGKVKSVRLRDPSPAVRRVVELTGLTDVLSIES
jgi:anti-sigma B factor antagonist